jgi:hypothetical protein
MKIVKNNFTLLEVLISLTLTVLLLTTLSSIYQQVLHLDKLNEETEQTHFKLRFVENRLADIFAQTASEYDLKDKFRFFTAGDAGGILAEGQPSLLFIIDNGVDLNASTAGYALGRLYVNKQRQLCLALWPAPSRWNGEIPQQMARYEVLLEQVDSLAFQFFIPPQNHRQQLMEYEKKAKAIKARRSSQRNTPSAPVSPVKTEEDEAGASSSTPPPLLTEGWVSEWQREYQALPALIKIRMTYTLEKKQGPQEIQFAFPLPRSPQIVIYE